MMAKKQRMKHANRSQPTDFVRNVMRKFITQSLSASADMNFRKRQRKATSYRLMMLGVSPSQTMRRGEAGGSRHSEVRAYRRGVLAPHKNKRR